MLTMYSCKVHLRVILPSPCRSFNWEFSSRLLHQNSVRTSCDYDHGSVVIIRHLSPAHHISASTRSSKQDTKFSKQFLQTNGWSRGFGASVPPVQVLSSTDVTAVLATEMLPTCWCFSSHRKCSQTCLANVSFRRKLLPKYLTSASCLGGSGINPGLKIRYPGSHSLWFYSFLPERYRYSALNWPQTLSFLSFLIQ